MARRPTPPPTLGQQWAQFLLKPWNVIRIGIGIVITLIVIDWFQHPEDFQKFFSFAIVVGVMAAGFRMFYRSFFPKKKGKEKGH